MSIFRELLAIKEFRENRAELAVIAQRGVLANAHAERDAAEQALEDFRAYAQRRETALYRDLCTRVVGLRDIEDVQQSVADLRQREHEFDVAREQAVARCAEELQRLQELQAAHQEAVRMKQKFIELTSVHMEELAKDAEMREDLELEEAASVRRDREEWDDSDANEEASA